MGRNAPSFYVIISTMKNKISANIALFMTALIWGLGFVSQRAGMEHIGPFTFNAARSFLGCMSLIPVILWVKCAKPDKRSNAKKFYQRINLLKAGSLCGLAMFTAMSIQQYSIQYVTAGKSGFITALYIIFVPLISLFLGAKIAKRVIFSVIMAVVGLYLLCYQAGGGINIYDILSLIGAFFYGVHILVVDHYSHRVHPVKMSCMQFLVVGLLSLIPMFFLETPTAQSIMECKIPLIYSGIITCGIAYTLQIYGQKYTLPILATLILCLESVFAVVGGALILGEVMTTREILGCVLMISAVVLANTKMEQRF